MMRILVAHNHYHYRGGEDTVVDAEVALLRLHGHQVRLYRRDNVELMGMGLLDAAASTLWSTRTTNDLRRIVADFRPQLLHAHNTFPLISPSLHAGAHRLQLPVVQTLHNFRLICPQAMLVRDGRSCTDCVGRVPWRGVLHRCYRGSLAHSAAVATTTTLHRLRRTWQRDVTRYIVLNQLCRDLFVEGGLPLEKLSIKPNFVEAAEPPQWTRRSGGVFVGRLSGEKGIHVLAQAMAGLPGQQITVFGKGPLQAVVERAAGLDYRGHQSPAFLAERLREAAYLVMPSTGVESFGLVAVEAFACGTPVIASRQGGMLELVSHGVNGLLVTPGDAGELARAIAWAQAHPQRMREMGRAAWLTYLERYTPERNYEQLMRIYEAAIASMPRTAPSPLPYAYSRAGR